MAERQHWSARWLDWGIRGNWLWSVFPSGWKVLIWSVFVGALGALIALIGKTTAIRGVDWFPVICVRLRCDMGHCADRWY